MGHLSKKSIGCGLNEEMMTREGQKNRLEKSIQKKI
jgi:hypothetical protein